MPDSLVLNASLIGHARTSGPHRQITLRIGEAWLTLNLLPEHCAIFPELQATTGGAHPIYDPTQVTFTPAPLYTVTIAPVPPTESAPPAEPTITTSEPSSTPLAELDEAS